MRSHATLGHTPKTRQTARIENRPEMAIPDGYIDKRGGLNPKRRRGRKQMHSGSPCAPYDVSGRPHSTHLRRFPVGLKRSSPSLTTSPALRAPSYRTTDSIL